MLVHVSGVGGREQGPLCTFAIGQRAPIIQSHKTRQPRRPLAPLYLPHAGALLGHAARCAAGQLVRHVVLEWRGHECLRWWIWRQGERGARCGLGSGGARPLLAAPTGMAPCGSPHGLAPPVPSPLSSQATLLPAYPAPHPRLTQFAVTSPSNKINTTYIQVGTFAYVNSSDYTCCDEYGSADSSVQSYVSLPSGAVGDVTIEGSYSAMSFGDFDWPSQKTNVTMALKLLCAGHMGVGLSFTRSDTGNPVSPAPAETATAKPSAEGAAAAKAACAKIGF